MSNDINAPILPASQNTKQVMWQTPTHTMTEKRTIVYQSDSMTQLMKIVDRVAPSQANILILGESGTGKELIANAVHERSNRKGKAFVAINCGALRESLLESELFGHEKGSFTGAYAKKLGLAEAANGGTLFLDEIGELAPAIQAKLLRFLQEGEIFRVGGKDPIKVDVRVICATNRDLEKEVQVGNFREDLFYRINTIVTQVPPLRRRKEDIPTLINHFLSQGSNQFLNRGKQMDAEAMKVMSGYDWPGNIRELQNVCERLQILSEGHMIMLNDLPENVRNPEQKDETGDYDPTITVSELEKRWILKALEHFDGNKTQAAQALGITIKTLYNKLHEYGEFDRFAVHSKPEKI
ncbi:MAG: sigma-54 interaction domain-containing protein [Bdellovibrio sp.]|jgi:transcriptional regulator with PAS, ATPase and Fis domain